jgi:hypothetical protein
LFGALSPEQLEQQVTPGKNRLIYHALLAEDLISIRRRTSSGQPAEHTCKVLLGLESARHSDVENPRFGVAQHLLCTLYSKAQEKLARALTRGLAKHLREMSCAESHTFRHFGEG